MLKKKIFRSATLVMFSITLLSSSNMQAMDWARGFISSFSSISSFSFMRTRDLVVPLEAEIAVSPFDGVIQFSSFNQSVAQWDGFKVGAFGGATVGFGVSVMLSSDTPGVVRGTAAGAVIGGVLGWNNGRNQSAALQAIRMMAEANKKSHQQNQQRFTALDQSALDHKNGLSLATEQIGKVDTLLANGFLLAEQQRRAIELAAIGYNRELKFYAENQFTRVNQQVARAVGGIDQIEQTNRTLVAAALERERRITVNFNTQFDLAGQQRREIEDRNSQSAQENAQIMNARLDNLEQGARAAIETNNLLQRFLAGQQEQNRPAEIRANRQLALPFQLGFNSRNQATPQVVFSKNNTSAD